MFQLRALGTCHYFGFKGEEVKKEGLGNNFKSLQGHDEMFFFLFLLFFFFFLLVCVCGGGGGGGT